jgi:hypothetical protein
LIGDPEVAAAGLEGTDVGAVSVRTFFAWTSALLANGDCATSGAVVAAVMSSLPGCCRFFGAGVEIGLGVTSLTTSLGSAAVFTCGLASAGIDFFLLVVLAPYDSFNFPSGEGVFCSFFFGVLCPATSSLIFLAASLVVCDLAAVGFVVGFVGVTG